MRSLFLLLFVSCAHTQVQNETLYFVGTIQRSSLQGQPYGPPFESLVRRELQDGRITECVIQEGKAFTVYLNRTELPQVYAVGDKQGMTAGQLVYDDATMKNWTYDIQVLKPTTGKITGEGRITQSGGMSIRKFWNQQVLMTESYFPATAEEFADKKPTSLECP